MTHPAPAGDEIRRVAGIGDDTLRNLKITVAYHELSLAVAELVGPGANWCTFATWASKQAGRTIREEDARRALERLLGGSSELARALHDLFGALVRRSDRLVERSGSILLGALSPATRMDLASEAVARGNRKVFAEIAPEFARFVETFQGAEAFDQAAIDAFVVALRPGPPPEGQDRLGAAFRAYHRALVEEDAKARAELLLLANLHVGAHEQTRLQPEIAAALNAAVIDAAELRRRILDEVFSGLRLARWVYWLYLRWTRPVGAAWERITRLARAHAREAITELLMTLELPTATIRLGRDLDLPYPPDLRELSDPDLVDVVRSVDPVAGGGAGSGAEDWADLAQRMHLITELFRSHHHEGRLHEAPFSERQTEAIGRGEIPAGGL